MADLGQVSGGAASRNDYKADCLSSNPARDTHQLCDLGELLTPSVPQCRHLQGGDNHRAGLEALL